MGQERGESYQLHFFYTLSFLLLQLLGYMQIALFCNPTISMPESSEYSIYINSLSHHKPGVRVPERVWSNPATDYLFDVFCKYFE